MFIIRSLLVTVFFCFLQTSEAFVKLGNGYGVMKFPSGNENDARYQVPNNNGNAQENNQWLVTVGSNSANETRRPSREELRNFFHKFKMPFRIREIGNRMCVDRDSNECSQYKINGYCTHPSMIYRAWMANHCPFSCGFCPTLHSARTRSAASCIDQRDMCDSLRNYCVGFFTEYMRVWCPRTCNFCGGSNSLRQRIRPEATHRQTLTNRITTNSGTCFPDDCGVVPIFSPRNRGKRDLNSESFYLKIVGGMRATRGKWPWHAMLKQQVSGMNRICGATIICSRWVVTAAHCLVSNNHGSVITRQVMRTFTLYVGRHRGVQRSDHDATQTFREEHFERFIIHPDFQYGSTFANDIALIKLRDNTQIFYNSLVQPVCLSAINDLRNGNRLKTYGWGDTMNRGPTAEFLKEISLPFVDRMVCERQLHNLPQEGVLCAGGEPYSDACSGDSGGSLVMMKSTNGTTNQRYYFYGITSCGPENCNSEPPYLPSVYTDISHYYEWIREQTNGCCQSSESILKNRFGRMYHTPSDAEPFSGEISS